MNTDKHRFFNDYWRLSALVCGLIFLFSSACFQTNQTNQPTNENSVVEVPTPSIDLAKPLEISEKAEDIALAKKIDEIIEQSEYKNARWGVFVVSLKDGRVLAAKDAQKLFNPASAQKILTSVVALDKLGADFRWKTSVYAKSEIKDGILDGDLTLYGQGAPDFDDEGVGKLVGQLKAKGLREIKGDIIGDDSFFKGDKLGDGWTWNDVQWYYGAEASALSIDKNLANITLQGGKPKSFERFRRSFGRNKTRRRHRSRRLKTRTRAKQSLCLGQRKESGCQGCGRKSRALVGRDFEKRTGKKRNKDRRQSKIGELEIGR